MKFFRSIFGKPDVPVQPQAPVEAGPDPVMAALAELEVKRLREALAAATPQPLPAPVAEPEIDMPMARPHRVVKTKASLPEGTAASSVSIWDLEDNPSPAPAPAPVAAASETVEPERRRPTRTKTRVLGFDAQPASVVSLFEDSEKPAMAGAPAGASRGHVMFPTGWLVVKEGPGQGAAFSLAQGIAQIGRGTDQTIALDFGDMAISRQNHAAIAYDAATHQFHIGHGGKSNLVRLNGRPLLSTEVVGDGDVIQIGETTLVLKVLCTSAFNWSETEAGGDGNDMAIA